MVSLLLSTVSPKDTAMHVCKCWHAHTQPHVIPSAHINSVSAGVGLCALCFKCSKLNYYCANMLYIFAFLVLGLHSWSLGTFLINVLLFLLIPSTVPPRYQCNNKHGCNTVWRGSFSLTFHLTLLISAPFVTLSWLKAHLESASSLLISSLM